MWRSGGKAFQFEGAANAKPMEGRLRHSKEASMQEAGARAEYAGARGLGSLQGLVLSRGGAGSYFR